MKKILLSFTLSFLFISSAFAFSFRDISENSSLKPAIEYLLEKELFEDGAFFKPQMPVTAELFWPLVLKDAGFNEETAATFGTDLPPNIQEDDPLAQYLREAIRRGFLSVDEPFDREQTISRIDAIKTLVKTKGIPVSQRTSHAFLNRTGGVPRQALYLPELEAAYASKLLRNIDIIDVKAHDDLTRETLALWLYNYDQNGIKRATLNPRGQHLLFPEKIESENKTVNHSGSSEENNNVIRISSRPTVEKIPRTAVLQDVFANILGKYRFPEQLSDTKREEMIEAAIAAMVDELGDRFSNYVAPAKSQEFQDNLNGEFEGIGAHVEMIDTEFTITAPIKGSPAMKSGILPGDVVTHVNEEDIRGLPIMETIDKIKGPAGTEVTLRIVRDLESLEITVERAHITVPTIELSFNKGIPVIGIHKFTASTKPELEKVLQEKVLRENPKGLVIDLRNDPGGLLTAAVALGEIFTNKGQKLFSIDYTNFSRDFTAKKDGLLANQDNIVVLQNKGTASASEILTSILQDYDLGTIIGTTSMGKGTVQEVINYNTGAILKLTVAKWLTPKGRWIQEDEDHPGIVPDIEVSDPTVQEIQDDIDRQLDTAIRFILDQ